MIHNLLTSPVLPQAILLLMVCFILLFSVFVPNNRYGVYAFSQLALFLTAWSLYSLSTTTIQAGYLFHEALKFDRLGAESGIVILILVFICFAMSRQYNREHNIPSQEFFILALLSTLGMLVLISAANLLSLYLGIELMSLPLYALIALKRKNQRCLESALKYFIIGALATGLLLYGFSFLFGLTGDMGFAAIQKSLSAESLLSSPMVMFSLILILSAILFKLGVVPFHSWVADVYDGAPNGVTLFIAGAPKVAVMIVLIRLLAGPFGLLAQHWQPVLEVAAALSIALGNLAAIAQSSIKRMLAYSSISHMGFALLGLCAAGYGLSRGYSAALFYIISYAVMSVGAFGFLVMLSRCGKELNEISDLKGLGDEKPWAAFIFMLLMFSMAGVPPLVGFIAKINVLENLIRVGLWPLAAFAILFSIIGAFYYIRVVKVMYFDRNTTPQALVLGAESYSATTVVGLAVLAIGLLPGALLYLCQQMLS